MANIRVYELAKELNMKNKVLLDKLSEMKISVSSHMSSLSSDAVARIKADVDGKKKGNADTARVKPTVIRKRKKRNRSSAPAKDGKQTSDIKESNEKISDKNEKSASLENNKTEKPHADIKDNLHKKPEKAESKDTAYPPKVSEKTKKKPGKISTKSKEDKDIKKDEPLKTKETRDKEAQASNRNSDKKPEKQLSKTEKRRAARQRKKARKETPAKIIKPAPIPAPNLEEQKPKEQIPAAAKADTPKKSVEPPKTTPEKIPETVIENISVQPEKTKGKALKKVDDIDDNEKGKETRWAKKKISFKRKEVVEGSDLYGARGRGKKGKKAAKGKPVKSQKTQITTPKAIKRRIKIDDTIILSDLAKRMGIKANEMIKKLMMLGVMVTVNQTIDFETAVLVASEFDYELEKASFEENTVLINEQDDDDPEKMSARSPVVTIMGHVDHGKTSLLDVIRKTKITEIEAGGITQHIGAYNVSTEGGQITFLDTPGHEAFTSMRARGATVTDIVVLVVAADDGVMPQTVEAINHSKAAGVPIIVAINKMDKPGADPERVVRELSEHGLMPEDWGGDTIFVKVSAKQNQGIDDLLEMILLQSEVLELKATKDKNAKGYVVESKLDSGRGPVATILIQDGTLHAGDSIVCGVHYGKVRAMINDRNQPTDSAGPSIPVEVLGLSGVPNAGDELIVVADDKSAKQVSEHRLQKHRSIELAKTSRISLEKLFEKMQKGEVKDLNLIIKADVQGSIEALSESLVKLSNDEVTINIRHSATGTVTESDISLAAVSDAIIIGFNVRPSSKVQALASEEHVDMRFYNIIYNVIKDVKDAILGMMESIYEERVLGMTEVREVFHVPKIGSIAGCYVTEGKIVRGKKIRLIRDGVIVHEGNISSLRRFKDDVKEVLENYECGIGIENYNDIKIGDVIECYYLEEIRPEL
ncbi:Translation initiation factor IF-2 [Desulfonema limicola]|uniref:Translation initiation factor IF-2 n=1 Tax=Desulfonema limicola TaxID=45656 RepID=A0A975B4I7_9BACT|nr:translation initiation factor IF-2 [Desulfonema limicola]QTA78649.1 Translation initiation factor IF-2 [Desulfonema limicola]